MTKAKRSAYDPLFGGGDDPRSEAVAESVRDAFAEASRAYLSSPWPWVAWAVLLPTAALLTLPVRAGWGGAAVLGLWSATILAGGAVEGAALLRGRRRGRPGPLGAWAMRAQGNLSLVAVVLSALVAGLGEAAFLPGLWLLLLGHSFFTLGGLAFRPLRTAGVVFQLGGAVALVLTALPVTGYPLTAGAGAGRGLEVFALTTALGCGWIALGLWRRRP